MQTETDVFLEKYGYYILLFVVTCLVIFYQYDKNRYTDIEERGVSVRATVVHVQFLKNDWNTLLEYRYRKKWYVESCLGDIKYNIGDTVTIKFENENPTGRMFIVENKEAK